MIHEHPLNFQLGTPIFENLGNGTPGGTFVVLNDPNYYSEITWIRFYLGTDGTVINRNVKLTLDWYGTDITLVSVSTSQPQNSTWGYEFLQIGTTFVDGVGTVVHSPLPARLIIPPSFEILIFPVNIQGGDQINFVHIARNIWPNLKE